MKKNKYERIEFVRELGLNTEENILILPGGNYDKQFVNKYDKFSLRTFAIPEQLKTPHYPIIEKKDLKKYLHELKINNLYGILASPIDPKDAEFAGTCMKDGYSLLFEIADGPGTVRRVTHQSILDRRYNLEGKFASCEDIRINQAAYEFRNTDIDDCIFEFSWYNHNVGHKSKQLIVWEVTDNGTKKSGI